MTQNESAYLTGSELQAPPQALYGTSNPPIWAMSLGSSYHTTPVDIWRSLDPQILMFSFYGLKY